MKITTIYNNRTRKKVTKSPKKSKKLKGKSQKV